MTGESAGTRRLYEAACHREGRFWVIEVTGWSASGGDFDVATTQARVLCREIGKMARDVIELVTGDTGVDLSVWGDRLVPDIYRARWQYHWPWAVTRPWLPRVLRGADEHCNPSISVVVPLLGWLVWFYKRGPMRTEADGPCPQCAAQDEAWIAGLRERARARIAELDPYTR